MSEKTQKRIQILLVAKSQYMNEIKKYGTRIDKESDKLLAMHKDDANNSIKQRAKVRARMSKMQEASDNLADKVVEINSWIADLKNTGV